MQAKLPVLAVTDTNTDIGEVIVNGGFGWWCESDDADMFVNLVKEILSSRIMSTREKEWNCLIEHFSVTKTYQTLLLSFGLESTV